MPNTPPQSTEHPPGSDKFIIITPFPGMDASIIERFGQDFEAIILLGFGNGSIPPGGIPGVRNVVAAGKSVFALADNAGHDHGVVRYSDVPQNQLSEAGAVLIESVNINHLNEFREELGKAIASGLRGAELSEFISKKFSFPEGEKPMCDPTNTELRIKHQLELNAALGLPPDTPLTPY